MNLDAARIQTCPCGTTVRNRSGLCAECWRPRPRMACSKCGVMCQARSGLCRKCWLLPPHIVLEKRREHDRIRNDRTRKKPRGTIKERRELLDHLLLEHDRKFLALPSLEELQWIDSAFGCQKVAA